LAVKDKDSKESFTAAEILQKYAVQTSLSQGKIKALPPRTAVKARFSLAPSVLELGTEGRLAKGLIDCDSATLEIMEEKCFIPVAKIKLVSDKSQLESSFRDAAGCSFAEFPTVRIAFDRLNISQHRCLIEMLYCRPGQWKRQETPGEWRSLWLLLRIALKPRAVFERHRQVRPIGVSQL